MSRTIILILAGVITLSIMLFFVNIWVSEKDTGVFLTQDTYMGTITWYEDSKTPPVPSDFNKQTPLIATRNDDVGSRSTQEEYAIAEADIAHIKNILNTTTAGPSLEEGISTGSGSQIKPTSPVVKAPIKEAPKLKTAVAEKKKKALVDTTVDSVVNNTNTKKPSLEKAFITQDTARPLRIEASNPVVYKAFYLANPERVVIDIDGILEIPNSESLVLSKNNYVKSLRVAYNAGNTRIVIDLPKKPKIWSVSYGKRKSSLDISLQY